MSRRWNRSPLDELPDVMDGLTRLERVILVELGRAQAELGGRNVSTAMLYGRVVEHVNVDPQEFQRALNRLAGDTPQVGAHQAGAANPRWGRAKK